MSLSPSQSPDVIVAHNSDERLRLYPDSDSRAESSQLSTNEEGPANSFHKVKVQGQCPSTPDFLLRLELPKAYKSTAFYQQQHILPDLEAGRQSLPQTDDDPMNCWDERNGSLEEPTSKADVDLSCAHTTSLAPFSSFASIDGSFTEGSPRSDADSFGELDEDGDQDLKDVEIPRIGELDDSDITDYQKIDGRPNAEVVAQGERSMDTAGVHQTTPDIIQLSERGPTTSSSQIFAEVRRSSTCTSASSHTSFWQQSRSPNNSRNSSLSSALLLNLNTSMLLNGVSTNCTRKKRSFGEIQREAMQEPRLELLRDDGLREDSCADQLKPTYHDEEYITPKNLPRRGDEWVIGNSAHGLTYDEPGVENPSGIDPAKTLLDSVSRLVQSDPNVILAANRLSQNHNGFEAEQINSDIIRYLHDLVNTFIAPAPQCRPGRPAKRRAVERNGFKSIQASIFWSRILEFKLSAVPHYTSFLSTLIDCPTAENMFAKHTLIEVRVTSKANTQQPQKLDSARLLASVMGFFRADERNEQAIVVRILLCVFLHIARYRNLDDFVKDMSESRRKRSFYTREARGLWKKFTAIVPSGHGLTTHDEQEFCATVHTQVDHGSKLAFLARHISLSAVVYLFTTGALNFVNIERSSKGGREATRMSGKAFNHMNISGALSRGLSDGLERALHLCLWAMWEPLAGVEERSTAHEGWTRFPGFD